MNNYKDFLKWVVDYLSAAMFWFGFGFVVIPVLPGTKQPAVKWDPWLNSFDPLMVHKYWTEHPDHEMGCIVGDGLIVFDADSPESVAALGEIEARYDLLPKMVVKTRKGEHHYYRRAPNTIAKSDAHDSAKHPERIDVKTGRALVVLPISTGKSLHVLDAENMDELSEVSQKFINAIFQHNGRIAPSKSGEQPLTQKNADDTSLQLIESLLNKLDPDCGYEDWLRVGMAIYHETYGSAEGMDLYDQWSNKGDKYKGIKDIETKWRSFRSDVSNPVTIRTLNRLAYEAEDFEICENEVIEPVAETPKKSMKPENPLDKFSLLGMSGEIEKQLLEEVYVLGEIALIGQSTVFYAAPNTGKTLLTIYMLTESIREGKINPTKVYYINVDDTTRGIHEKLQIAEEYGFHMLAEGYKDFKVSEFYDLITRMIESEESQGVIIVLDTLKKFTDLMSKKLCTQFGKIIRRFVMKGGTVISLAHVNKNPGQDGKLVHAGTTDIVEDSDCIYMLTKVSEESNQNVVEFTNKKKRGNVTLSAAYSYSVERDISYNELLLSVEEVDDKHLIQEKQKTEILSDADVISAIEYCIKGGVNTKMKLAETAAERALASKRQTLKVIDKYTGKDPNIHRWSYEVRERGAKVYKLLKPLSVSLPDPDLAEF